MSLSQEDCKWLKQEFDGVTRECREAIKEHEGRFHPPGRQLKTISTLLGIGAAGAVILGALLGGLLWLVQHA
jgi:hypothetical protein